MPIGRNRKQRSENDGLLELPNTEMIKSVTIRLASGRHFYFFFKLIFFSSSIDLDHDHWQWPLTSVQSLLLYQSTLAKTKIRDPKLEFVFWNFSIPQNDSKNRNVRVLVTRENATIKSENFSFLWIRVCKEIWHNMVGVHFKLQKSLHHPMQQMYGLTFLINKNKKDHFFKMMINITLVLFFLQI